MAMVNSRTGFENSIKSCYQLQNIHISPNPWLKMTNTAWIMKCEYQKFQRKPDLVIPVLCVWRSEFDCYRFLRMSATCLDENEGLKQALEVFSVLKIFGKNVSFVLRLQRSLGLVLVSDHLPMCYVACFDKSYGLIMPCLHIQDFDITPLTNFPLLSQFWILAPLGLETKLGCCMMMIQS